MKTFFFLETTCFWAKKRLDFRFWLKNQSQFRWRPFLFFFFFLETTCFWSEKTFGFPRNSDSRTMKMVFSKQTKSSVSPVPSASLALWASFLGTVLFLVNENMVPLNKPMCFVIEVWLSCQSYMPVVLKLGSIEPQGFDDSGSGVQRRLRKVYALHTLRVLQLQSSAKH